MVFNNSILLGAAGQGGAATFDPTLIGNSVWLDGSADTLEKTFSSGSAQTKVVISTWVQRHSFGSDQTVFSATGGTGGSSRSNRIQFRSDDTIDIHLETSTVKTIIYSTTAVFRDIGFYHILVSIDQGQTQGPAQVKLFVNGNEVSIAATVLDQGFSAALSSWGNACKHNVGSHNTSTALLKGTITQTTMLVGQSIQSGDVAVSDFLDTFTFGTNGSQFIPKRDTNIAALATTAGGNSFCLNFGDSSNLGNDISSNNNDFTATSMSSANQTTNTPSKVYATLNPLVAANATFDLASGATEAISAVNNGNINASMVLPSTGVYYWEVERNEANDGAGTFSWYAGIMEADGNADAIMFLSAVGYSYYSFNGTFYEEGSAVATGNSWNADGDKVAFEFDADNGTLKYYKNNSLERTKTGLTHSGGYVPFVARTGGSTSSTLTVKFKESEWAYTPPTSGALELVSTNIPTPSYQGIDYFDATLYEGNGGVQRVGDFVPFTDAYTVTNSVMFDDGDSRSLTLNSSATRTSATVAAFSLWTKRGNLGINARPLTVQVDGNNYFGIYYNTSDQLDFTINNGGATILQRITTRAFKDKSAWHNIVVIINQGESTQADRVKVFYDGVQIPNDSTGFGTNTCTLDGSSALNFLDNASVVHDVGGGSSSGFSQPYDGYIAEVAFLDGADSGAKLNASDFGQVDTSTNRWVAKDIGSYNFGNTGYYLEFKVAPGTSNGAGTDTSGESNNFTSNGSWATSDQFTDCPSQNFDVLGGAQVGGTISEGNTKAALGTGGNQIRSNFNLSSGKWYVESDIQATNNSASIGLVPSRSATFSNGPGRDANGGISYETDGDVFSDNVQNATAEASFAAGDVIQMAIDMDAKKVYFGKNNTFGGDPAAGTGGHFLPTSIISDGAALITLGNYSGSQSSTQQINYGQFLNFDGGSTTNGFKYTPPTGFKAVNQDNLDDTASKLTAWAWIKNRDAADNHMLFDRVRGTGKDLHSNSTAAEATNANTVQRFLQRGVQVGNDAEVNTASESYVLWQWLVGDSATTGSTNSDGSVDTTVIAADAGHFSVVKGTTGSSGATFGHGLGAAPDLIINKDLNNSSSNWLVYNSISGASFYLALNSSGSINGPGSTVFGTEPTSTVFTLGSFFANVECINYCFRSVPGLCKVGQYEGNSSSDGTYINLGFKPRWIMVKVVDSGVGADGNWTQYDTARQPFNSTSSNPSLEADTSDTEKSNSHKIDILSDGVKFRDNSFQTNHTLTYLYLAMADIGGNGTLPPIYGR